MAKTTPEGFRFKSEEKLHLIRSVRWWRAGVCGLLLILAARALPISASDKTTVIKVPPVKIPINVKDQQITIVASALITLITKTQGRNDLKLELGADLGDLQQNMTGLLSTELDKDDHCGDRIAVQHATLTPADKAGMAVVELHYERWGCAKVFGKQEAKRLVGGNAVIQLKLTPAIEEHETELRLIPEVGPVQADGSLGELLRSGAVGQMLQEKIRKAVLSALQKGTDLSRTLPPAAQGYVKITNAEFQDAGGRLELILGGEIQFTNQQVEALAKQVKERAAAK